MRPYGGWDDDYRTLLGENGPQRPKNKVEALLGKAFAKGAGRFPVLTTLAAMALAGAGVLLCVTAVTLAVCGPVLWLLALLGG